MYIIPMYMSSLPLLKLAVSSALHHREDLKKMYVEQIRQHNEQVLSNPFPNAGFDLFVPEQTVVDNVVKPVMVSMQVKCEMVDTDGKPLAYYMYPRSSLSKTPLLLANHVGIIDAGYRGPLIGAFRNLSEYNYIVEKDTRLLQICHGSLKPFIVELVEEEALSGFGSTGK